MTKTEKEKFDREERKLLTCFFTGVVVFIVSTVLINEFVGSIEALAFMGIFVGVAFALGAGDTSPF